FALAKFERNAGQGLGGPKGFSNILDGQHGSHRLSRVWRMRHMARAMAIAMTPAPAAIHTRSPATGVALSEIVGLMRGSWSTRIGSAAPGANQRAASSKDWCAMVNA